MRPAVASPGVGVDQQQQEALRQVRANLAAAAAFLAQCGDAINLRSEPIVIDKALASFARKAIDAEELVVDLLRLLPPAAPSPRRPGPRRRITA